MSKQTLKTNNSGNPYADREGIVYARVSSKRQEIEGSGLESQEGRCLSDLMSIKVIHVKTFADSYTGGGDFMNRPAMRGLLDYIDKHPYKKFVVVFDDLKRFARDVEFHLKLRAAFKSRDVELRCLNYKFDESAEGKFVETILAASNELDRHQNKRQVIQKQRARLEAGYWAFCGKKGYVMTSSQHGKIAVPHPVESKILATALEGFAKGIFVRKIDACEFLTTSGFWKRSAPEKYIAKFDEFLKDPFYCGDIEYLPWEVTRRKAQHQAIISTETYELNQKRINKNQVRVRRDAREDFPMRGLIICGDCSEHLTAATTTAKGKTYEYYFCQNHACASYRKSLKKTDIESGFEKLLKGNSLKSGLGDVVTALFDEEWKEEISALKDEEQAGGQFKVSLQNKVEALTNMVVDAKSESLRKVYESQLEKAASELENMGGELLSQSDLNIPYRNALDKALRLVESPYEIWSEVDVLEKQRLFYFLFESKIPYSQNEGYRNDNITCAVRLFEAFAGANTIDVDMGVSKPRVMKVGK